MTDKTTSVRIASAWVSKINWTQAVGMFATLLGLWGINMDSTTQVMFVTTIQGVQGIVTWAMRTWFTTSITPSSM